MIQIDPPVRAHMIGRSRTISPNLLFVGERLTCSSSFLQYLVAALSGLLVFLLSHPRRQYFAATLP
jgi:hypothetical protein